MSTGRLSIWTDCQAPPAIISSSSSSRFSCSPDWSWLNSYTWASSFLMAHQHTTGRAVPWKCWHITRLSCRSQTRATCCITANMLQTKVDAQCDDLATELSWQRFVSTVANLQLLHLHLTYPTCIWRLHWGWPRLSFAEICDNKKLESLGYHVALCVILAISAEHQLVMYRHTTTPNTHAS